MNDTKTKISHLLRNMEKFCETLRVKNNAKTYRRYKIKPGHKTCQLTHSMPLVSFYTP